MKQIEKKVTAIELFDVISAVRKRIGEKELTWEGFKRTIATHFLGHPALLLRWHDIQGDTDFVYILDHKDIANALDMEYHPGYKDPL